MPTELQSQLFPGQRKDERIYKVLRKHWFAYVPFFIVAIGLIVVWITAIIFLVYNKVDLSGDNGTAIIVVSGTYTLFAYYFLMYGFVNYYLDTYIITDQRIVDIAQEGLFKRRVSELHMHQVQDVSANVTNIFGTMLHFGNVEIQTAGERANFIFVSIGHPYKIAKLIIDLHEKHIESRNVGIDVPQIAKELEDEKEIDIGERLLSWEKKVPKDQEFAKDKKKEQSKEDRDNSRTYGNDEGELVEGKETDLK